MPDIYAVRVKRNDQIQVYDVRDRIARNGHFIGDVYTNANPDYTGGNKLPDENRVNTLITSAISGITTVTTVVVQERPLVGEPNIIYFVPHEGDDNDIYDEFMYINNSWELIGTTQVDISSKADKEDTVLDTTLSMGRAANSTIGTKSTALGNNVTASGNNSQAFGASTLADGFASHAEGASTAATGYVAHAEGAGTTASGAYSHSEGTGTTASAESAHAEGGGTLASGSSSHAEGGGTTASGQWSHAEGGGSRAIEDYSHAEGSGTLASGGSSHAEGSSTTASGTVSHAEGLSTTASGTVSHAEGSGTIANHKSQHVSGEYNVADPSLAEATERGTYAEIIGNGVADNNRSNARTLDWNGNEEIAGSLKIGGSFSMNRGVGDIGNLSTSEGSGTIASGAQSHAEGFETQATGDNAHAEGYRSIANGALSHTEGAGTRATGNQAHAEGSGSQATGNSSHAEGDSAQATSFASHAEGTGTLASGSYAHAEGSNSVASGAASHAEGSGTIANGMASHVGGMFNTADNYDSWPEWTANKQYYYGDKVKRIITENSNTIIKGYICTTGHISGSEFSSSKWLEDNKMNYVEIIGNGTNNNRSNARTLDWNGNEKLSGGLDINGPFSMGRIPGSTVGVMSTVEGSSNIASAQNAHAEGATTEATGAQSHAEGSGTHATGNSSHAEGYSTQAIGDKSHAEGSGTQASGAQAHAEGNATSASAQNAHAEGANSQATGNNSHAEGNSTIASGADSHTEGAGTRATGSQAHAEGAGSQATASVAHAEGAGTQAIGPVSHSEGSGTIASGAVSHAEGSGTQADGAASHAEGTNTIAKGASSHVVGMFNSVDNYSSWPEWVPNTEYAVGDKVKITSIENNVTISTGYVCKTANSDSEFTASKWNTDSMHNYVEIVGNGANNGSRSNARSLEWNGNEHLAGDVYVHANVDGSGGNKLPDETRVNALITAALGNIATFDISIVQNLPQSGNAHTVYFIPKTGSTGDVYDEYMYINNTWELIGTTQIDISGKADKTDTVLNTSLSRGRKSGTTPGMGSIAFGDNVEASGVFSQAEGTNTAATQVGAHAEGNNTKANGVFSHAEGVESEANNSLAHAEGSHSVANGSVSHAEGTNTIANGANSHSQGWYTIANGHESFVYGRYNAPDIYSDWHEWVPGLYYVVGDKKKRTITVQDGNESITTVTGYICNTANNDLEFIESKWDQDQLFTFAEIVGNGTAVDARSNARTLDWDGNERLAGDLYVHANSNGTGGRKVLTENDLEYTTEADALKIISDFWEEEEDDSVIAEMVLTSNGYGFESVLTANEIGALIESGKMVILHFPGIEGSTPDSYIPIASYAPAVEGSQNYPYPSFALCDIAQSSPYINLVRELNYVGIDPNTGKLSIPYAD